MSSNVLETPDGELLGVQKPRISLVPDGIVSSAATEVIELADQSGLHLDPWEKLSLHQSLGERADGRWAAYEVGLVVPRQNGKGSILEARELGGLFLFGEKLIIHSAHEQVTATEHFRRLLTLIESNPDLDRRVMRAPKGKGMEQIELRGGARIFFKTRTTGGGRGLTGDLVVLDEAMILALSTMAALVPTMAARSMEGNPQLWYAGSAVDQAVHQDGLVLAGLRRRALEGAPRTTYLEWSIEGDNPDDVPPEVLSSRESWAQGNPGLGIRISEEHIENEHRAMGPRQFAVERCGVGDWPEPPDPDDDAVIGRDTWAALAAEKAEALTNPVWSIDVSPDRQMAAIGVAGFRPDGLPQGEVADHRAGTGWIVDRCKELKATHGDIVFRYDENGPVRALVRELTEAEIRLKPVTAKEHSEACGQLVDMVEQAAFRHDGYPALAAAVAGAGVRPLGDAWAWSRRASGIDITPLVAVTLALWAARPKAKEPLIAWR